MPTLFQLHDRFIGAMGWNDIYGNPNLVPSKGMNTTCGLVWKISEEYKARISVDLFYNRIEDMIETVVTKKKTATENAVTTYKNIEGTSKFKGIEVSLSTDIPYGFGIDIGGDYMDAKDPDGHDLKNRVINIGIDSGEICAITTAENTSVISMRKSSTLIL